MKLTSISLRTKIKETLEEFKSEESLTSFSDAIKLLLIRNENYKKNLRKDAENSGDPE